MKMTMIKAERLIFGDFRFRVEVGCSVGWFRWCRVYHAKPIPMLGLEWSSNGGPIANKATIKKLGDMLADGLLAKQVVPQSLPKNWKRDECK